MATPVGNRWRLRRTSRGSQWRDGGAGGNGQATGQSGSPQSTAATGGPPRPAAVDLQASGGTTPGGSTPNIQMGSPSQSARHQRRRSHESPQQRERQPPAWLRRQRKPPQQSLAAQTRQGLGAAGRIAARGADRAAVSRRMPRRQAGRSLGRRDKQSSERDSAAWRHGRIGQRAGGHSFRAGGHLGPGRSRHVLEAQPVDASGARWRDGRFADLQTLMADSGLEVRTAQEPPKQVTKPKRWFGLISINRSILCPQHES